MPESTSEAWAQIRYDYEHTGRPIEEICAAHGISSGTLRDRMRRWGWTRRRPPIPREGPPAVFARRIETEARPSSLCSGGHSLPQMGEGGIEQFTRSEEPPTPTLPFPGGGSTEGSDGTSTQHSGGAILQVAATATPDGDPALIGPRLQSAVARVLPAIEATIARLGAGPQQPRELEQTARALGTLTRTLRELNALLSKHQAQHDDYDDRPIDEIRCELARQIEAFVRSRPDEEGNSGEPQP